MPKKSYLVRMRSVVIEDYVVMATNEEQARRKVVEWDPDSELANEVERPDWEVIQVTAND